MVYLAVITSLIICCIISIFLMGHFEDKIRDAFKSDMDFLIDRVSIQTGIPRIQFYKYSIDDGLDPKIVLKIRNEGELTSYVKYIKDLYDTQKFSVRLHLLLVKLHKLVYLAYIWVVPICVAIYSLLIESWQAPMILFLFGIVFVLYQYSFVVIVKFLTGFHPHHSDRLYITETQLLDKMNMKPSI